MSSRPAGWLARWSLVNLLGLGSTVVQATNFTGNSILFSSFSSSAPSSVRNGLEWRHTDIMSARLLLLRTEIA